MARGIKKISENVIANKRSLTLVTASVEDTLALQEDVELRGVTNTEAMPLGMLNVDYAVRGLSMKVSQGEKDSESVWSKLDAKHTLIQQSIVTNLLRDQAVTEAKIADYNVTTNKIKDQAITTSKINDMAVTTEKINDMAVTTPKLASEAVTNDKLARNAVSTIKIQDKAVTTEKINDQAVTNSRIANLAVSDTKLADGAVVTRAIRNEAVTESKIANGAVTEWKIADQAIHAHNIAVGGISNANLQDSCVSTDKIDDLAVTNEKIADETINGGVKIAKHSITKDRLVPELVDSLDRAVIHDGSGNVNGTNSTQIHNLKATGDIYAQRVYNVVYMDIAEGYIPGEELEPGDIVAMHEDGKVYKAETINDCIVGVVSNEYAHCLGTSEEELISGNTVAVGMIGKIHVKVKGPVRLGQRISISANNPGIGCANWMNNNNIGQALETVQCGYNEIHTVLVQVRPM